MTTYEVEAPSGEDVAAVIEQVWASFLGADLVETTADGDSDEVWSGTVTMSGPDCRIVSVSLPDQAARALTRHWLMDDAVSDEDVSDSVGELINIIGGNVKSLFVGPSVLSLPVVSTGTLRPPSSAHEECRVPTAWSGHPVTVTVHAVPQGVDLDPTHLHRHQTQESPS